MPSYCVSIRLPFKDLEDILPFFDSEDFLSLSWYECPDAEPSNQKDENDFSIAAWFWIEAITKKALNPIEIEIALCLFKKAPSLNYEILVKSLPEQDWQEKVYQSMKPIRIRQFYIHSTPLSDYEKEDEKRIFLHIRAATAFGSGEHPTTHTCLEALDDIKMECPTITTCLDMGCGSGILAIGAAKLWPLTHILAVDIDPEAVRVTKNNALENQVQLDIFESNGFENSRISSAAPYQVIIANILAAPLMEMVPQFKSYIAQEGYVVLSGLLKRQASTILDSFRLQGFYLYKTYILNDWQTLVLR